MSQINKTIANIYNPLNLDKKTLLDNFVIRHKEFDKIFRDIKTSKLNQTSQNFLIQGQRGSGKTTLLAKLRYEIEDSKKLSHMLVIQFKEDQYNIFSLNRLWETIADIMEDMDGFENIVEELEEFDDDEDFYSIIKKYLKKNRRKLILLIDNFGDLLDKLKEKEHRKLRDVLHESDLQIIAGSTRTLETAYKHDKPFFESFKTIYLEPLTKNDVQILLEHLSKYYDNDNALDVIKKQTSRIETIRRLTGGVPRTLILLYEMILNESANVFEDLEGILDKITPLYKHKMDDLPTQQQVIIDAIALNWDGMLSSEISKKTKIETKKISAQLKSLEKGGFVSSKYVNKKNKLYMIEERFFNIWYLMRFGRKKKKQQVLWLVSFFKDWCTDEEFVRKAEKHISLAINGELNHRGCYYMAEALSQTIQDPELKYEVLKSTKKYINETNPEFADSLSGTDEIVSEIISKAIERKDFSKAEKYLLVEIENKNVNAMYKIMLLYEKDFGNYNKANAFYSMAIEEDFNTHMNFLLNIGFLDNEIRNHSVSIFKKYYNKSNHIESYAFSVIMIHAEKYKDSVMYFNRFLDLIVKLDLIGKTDDFQKHITDYLIFLLSRKQYHLAFELFQGEKHDLKGKIKPVYYALMYFLQDEYPKEYKRMGTEISDTVKEIVDKIKTMEK